MGTSVGGFVGDTLGKPQAAPAPDYTGAAYAQAASARNNQVTPYGSLNWSQADPKNQASPWTSTINLTPDAQAALDSQMRLSKSMGGLAEQYAGQVNANPMDLSSVQQTADKAYGALTSRLDPQWEQREGMQKTALANQGLAPGGEAYTNAMRDFGNQRNDAYQQANLAAIQTMPQTYQLASAQYQQPLNQLNALRTGAQIQNPQFTPMGSGANLLGATQGTGAYEQNQFNQQMGSYNAMLQGLFGMGSAAAGKPA